MRVCGLLPTWFSDGCNDQKRQVNNEPGVEQTNSIHTKMNHSSLPSTGKISFSLGLDVAVSTVGVGLLQVNTQAIL